MIAELVDPSKASGKAPRSVRLFAPVLPDIAEADRILDAALAQYDAPLSPLIEHLQHYRGKRLRPALLFLVAKACGGIAPAHHTLAAAVEMIHTATLVHDDVLDDAETRRHVPTFNANWGNRSSILLGDLLFTHAFHLTSFVDGRACRIIGEATNRVCAGELKQIRNRGNWHLAESEYFDILDGKTAALTEVCGQLGALYAGASERIVAAAACYARNLGLAFQVADDLLDLTGDEDRVGKTLGTDLAEGKLTLPLIHALAVLPASEAAALRHRLANFTVDDRRDVAQTLQKTGSIRYAERLAEDLARRARESLAALPAGDCRTSLELIATWSVQRER